MHDERTHCDLSSRSGCTILFMKSMGALVRFVRFAPVCVLALGLGSVSAAAQPIATRQGQAPIARLRVATRLVSPFVIEEGGELKGFSIELWQEISRRLGVQ